MAKPRTMCMTCNRYPTPGTKPDCKECRFILNIPRGKHGAIRGNDLLRNILMRRNTGCVYDLQCKGRTVHGLPCTRAASASFFPFCAFHKGQVPYSPPTPIATPEEAPEVA